MKERVSASILPGTDMTGVAPVAATTDRKPVVDQTTLFILIALLAASIEPVLVRLGYRGSATPSQLWFARTLVAGAVVVPITRSLKRVNFQQFRAIAGVGPLLLATTFANLYALKTIPVALLVTGISTTPAVVALGNQFLGRDKTSLKFWLGFACCLLGIALSVDVGSIHMQPGYTTGLALVGSAMLSSAMYRVRLEGLTKVVEPLVASTWFFVVNAIITLILLPLCASIDGADSPWTWVSNLPKSVIYIAIWAGIASVLANVMFVQAVKALGSTRMSMFDLLQRPIVVIFAALILGESLSWSQVAGFVLVLIGVRWAKTERRPL